MPIPLGVLAVAGAGGVAPVPPGNAYEWLETTVVGSGGAANVTFSNLNTNYSSTYKHLQLRMVLRSTRSAAADSADINFNSNTSDYRWHALRGSGSAVEAFDGGAGASYMQAGLIPGNTNVANHFGALVVDILDPFSSNKNTTIRTQWGMHGSNENFVGFYSGAWFNTSVITSMTIDCTNANFAQYSRFSLYGLRSA